MDVSYKQEVTVGGLVLLAIALFLVGTSWLGGRSIGPRRGNLLQIEFKEVGNLKLSSLVRISGVGKGKVEHIELADVGRVLVSVSLDKDVVPKIDASATIVPVGFVGDAAVDLNPGRAPEPLPAGRVIVGSQAVGLTDRLESLGSRADTVLSGVQEIANERTARDLHNTLQAMQRTLNLLSAQLPGTTGDARKAMAALRQLSERLDSTLANPALGSMLSHLDTTTARLNQLTTQFTTTGARLDTVLAGITGGEGTLGLLATDSGLYHDARATSQSLTALLEELKKHPGKITVQIKIF